MINPITNKEEPVLEILKSLVQDKIALACIAELEELVLSVHTLTISDRDAYGKIHMIHARCDQLLGHKQ